MNNSSGALKFLGVAVVVIVVSLAAGYYFSGGPQKDAAPPATTAADQSADTTTQQPASAAQQPRSVARSSEYTAADAPSIDIKEVKPRPTTKKTTPDSEASQTGVTPAANTPPGSGLIGPGGTALSATAPSTDASTTTGSAAPPPPPAAVTTPGEGLTPSTPAPAQPAVDDGGGSASADAGPIYHVLVGNEFADSRNAHIYASSLQHRGYIAVVESINSGSGTVYKVQVGAYKNRVAAEDEVNQLQQSGFNAYVATDR